MEKLNLAKSQAFTMAGAGQRTPLIGLRPTESGAILGLRACGQRVAFTMAEILLSLTIIGVVAAITLPSLTGNINERTWHTQRKALLSRFSQAIALMPSLNGYGVGATDADTIAKASEVFITSGLSKVLKINNICSYGEDGSTLYDCGFTSQQITNAAGTKVNLPKQLSDLNGSGLVGAIPGTTLTIKNTKAAAFETANGESVLTFYNPECKPANVILKRFGTEFGTEGKNFYFRQQLCVNFVFDLNGKKGPNTVGKDIGMITVIYPSDSKVVMPMYPKSVALNKTYQEATSICKNLSDGEYRLPNLEELMSIYYNKYLVGGELFSTDGRLAWTTTAIDSTHVWTVGQGEGVKYTTAKTVSDKQVACVQR